MLKKTLCYILSITMIAGLCIVQNCQSTKAEVKETVETNYIIECDNKDEYKNIYNQVTVKKEECGEMLEENNIQIASLNSQEVKTLRKKGITVEKDIKVKGSNRNFLNRKKINQEKKNNECNENIKSLGCESIQNELDYRNPVKVAILDSGIDYTSNINVVERKNFLDDDVSPLYEDNTGHGTAIAGIIASDGTDGTVKGINPDVQIYSARILDTDNSAPISKVVEAIYWAIDSGVKIINISFGTSINSEILHNAIKKANDAGILIFAASGNQGKAEGGSNVEYPAAFDEVVAVGATDEEGKILDMTSRGDELDIVAPGENIHSLGWLGMEVI